MKKDRSENRWGGERRRCAMRGARREEAREERRVELRENGGNGGSKYNPNTNTT